MIVISNNFYVVSDGCHCDNYITTKQFPKFLAVVEGNMLREMEPNDVFNILLYFPKYDLLYP